MPDRFDDVARRVPLDQPVVRSAIIAVALIALAAAAAWWWSQDNNVLPLSELPIEPVLAAGSDVGITVHVSGEVASPGLVRVRPDARVADAVAASGGALSSADLSGLNLAAPMRDGERISVPTQMDDALSPKVDDGRVRVNDADVAAMEALPGVGPVLAQRIVSHREEEGLFSAVEDLLDVPGIGEGKLAAMRDVIALP